MVHDGLTLAVVYPYGRIKRRYKNDRHLLFAGCIFICWVGILGILVDWITRVPKAYSGCSCCRFKFS